MKAKALTATNQLVRTGCYGISEGGAPSLRAGESQPGLSAHGRKAEMPAGRWIVGLSAMVYTEAGGETIQARGESRSYRRSLGYRW